MQIYVRNDCLDKGTSIIDAENLDTINESVLSFNLQKAFATTTGIISEGIAIDKWLHVIRGAAARENAPRRELTFQAYTTRKKTFMSRVCMAESTLGQGSLISTQKGSSCGAMGAHLNLRTGRRANQTTMAMKIVFILLASSKIIITSGMT